MNQETSKAVEIRPFKILGIQQIAIGGPQKSQLKKLWVDLLGLDVKGSFVSETENVDEDICSVGHGMHSIEIDLMQPIDLEKKPAVHTTPLNHIGLWVDDLKMAVEWLTSRGLRFTPGGIRKGASGHDICFIHPKSSAEFPLCGEGVLIELVQAPDDVVSALSCAA
jgi:lactoylglutathione lyase